MMRLIASCVWIIIVTSASAYVSSTGDVPIIVEIEEAALLALSL